MGRGVRLSYFIQYFLWVIYYLISVMMVVYFSKEPTVLYKPPTKLYSFLKFLFFTAVNKASKFQYVTVTMIYRIVVVMVTEFYPNTTFP